MKMDRIWAHLVLVLFVVLCFWLVVEVRGDMSGIGLPDWGRIKKGVGVSPLADLGELAARLGSINTFDRRGDTVWMDDFEDGIIKWDWAGGGTGATVASNTTRARNGAKSAVLTTGNAINNWAMIRHWMPPPVVGKLGYELSFTKHDSMRGLEVYAYRYDGTNVIDMSVHVDVVNSRLQVMGAGATWVTVQEDVALKASTYLFHTLKVVVDWENGTYARLLLDGLELDLSAYALQSTEDDSAPHMRFQVFVYTTVASNISIYLDDVIITQNEP